MAADIKQAVIWSKSSLYLEMALSRMEYTLPLSPRKNYDWLAIYRYADSLVEEVTLSVFPPDTLTIPRPPTTSGPLKGLMLALSTRAPPRQPIEHYPGREEKLSDIVDFSMSTMSSIEKLEIWVNVVKTFQPTPLYHCFGRPSLCHSGSPNLDLYDIGDKYFLPRFSRQRGTISRRVEPADLVQLRICRNCGSGARVNENGLHSCSCTDHSNLIP